MESRNLDDIDISPEGPRFIRHTTCEHVCIILSEQCYDSNRIISLILLFKWAFQFVFYLSSYMMKPANFEMNQKIKSTCTI